MGGNTSKRTIPEVWNGANTRLQDFDINKPRRRVLMKDFDNPYQNSHRSPRRELPPHIDTAVQRGRTKLLNLPDELAGISEPGPFPRFPTGSDKQHEHRLLSMQKSSYTPSRNRESRQAYNTVVKSKPRHRENPKHTLRPILKPDKHSHHHHHHNPVPAHARVQQRPIQILRSSPEVETPERHSYRSRSPGRPTAQHHRRERDQLKKPSAEKYYRTSPRERHSSRPHRTQRMSHGETLQPSSRPHHRKVEGYDQSPPSRVDRRPSTSQLKVYPKNPYAAFKQEPRLSYYNPRVGVLNIYV